MRSPHLWAQSWAPSQELWSFPGATIWGTRPRPRLPLADPWMLSPAGTKGGKRREESMRKAGQREIFRPRPGGLWQSMAVFFPAAPPPHLITFPCFSQRGVRRQGGPGRGGPQKLGPQEQVGEDATDQATDPGHPKAPRACTDIISALKGRAVFLLSPLALLITNRLGCREGPEAGNVSRAESTVPRIVLQPWLPAPVLII